MELARLDIYTSQHLGDLEENILNLGLKNYASDAANEMGFDSLDELYASVRRAMDICVAAEIPIRGNFQRICKSTEMGLVFDWKLSPIAYKLVCLSGKPSNPMVGCMTIQLLFKGIREEF
jgi:hypothetical protein